jgi:PD-(D/E)XK nuclease superfamily
MALSRTKLGTVFSNPILPQHPDLLSSLHRILVAVEQDTSPRTLDGGGAATLFAGARYDSVRTCLDSLRRLLVERVRSTLTAEKVTALRTLLGAPVPDFLDIIGHSLHENSNSSMLGWLLDPRTAPTIGPASLVALTSRFDDGGIWRSRVEAAVSRSVISVQRECPVVRDGTTEPHPGRIDLVVWGPDFVLAIENKVLAKEHSEQTDGYWSWLAEHRIAHAGIFLSPAGLPANSESFMSVSYLDLLACLMEGPARMTPAPAEEAVLASYVKTLAGTLLRSELRLIEQSQESEN